MKSVIRIALCLFVLVSASGAAEPRLNQIQVIGTHNSYHIAPHDDLKELLGVTSKRLVEGLDYTHKPLHEQFSNQGIRQIELDVFADPQGGLYANPSSRKTLKALGKSPGPDFDEELMKTPGFKVLHVQDIDYVSTTPTFVIALKQIREWSKAHPKHVPIMILVELKDNAVPALPTQPIAFDTKLLDGVDAEIDSVFDRGHILTPDDLRAGLESLPEAIKSKGWPTLDSVRGKVMFGLDNEGKLRDLYLEGHDALKGRRMFATAPSFDHPAAAWFKINDPNGDFDRIQEAVSRGFMVRTRADADTRQARTNNTSQRDKALASGAQFVSSDYPVARPDFSNYSVTLPGNKVARVNPISGKGLDPELELDTREVK